MHKCREEVAVPIGSVDKLQTACFVSVPVAQLGRHVSVWHGSSRPTGVAVNSVGEVVVSERIGDVVIYDKEGKRLRSFQHNLTWCDGVAVDGENNIYCIDFIYNKIMRCNKNGGRVKVPQVNQVQCPGHCGMAVIEDEVMVCELGNEGTIMVYDRELKCVRQIVGRGMGRFCDLSPDSHGNLYVTDCDNSVIRVFSVDGDLLRSFGCDENGVKKLSRPRGVCVS